MADLPHPHQGPLVTITFYRRLSNGHHEKVERHWHHVPRVGEHVNLEGDEDFGGRVVDVLWHDGSVDVDLS